ncbi:hypothetical protein [Mangrovihabitans endophyticus]|uniref:Rubrerythrin n=1 Tax=Mangrovihabitans endophyticus TaxID=1751298 RepID=A0A8J3FPL7_9ACTN|nr:hypothetical protein [Mangrovihabitans endophyticus]GGK90987.1 rubrerythrin [Mangrovihabitans endophyticus]
MTELNGEMLAELRAAFLTESMNVQRYAHFAEVAGIEGHLALAELFQKLCATTACVARGHLDLLQEVVDPATDLPMGGTGSNAACALAGELDETTRLYPRLATAAHDTGLADVASWFETLVALKKAHTARLEQALATVTPEGEAP